ncbi:MFS transporter [Acidipila rosea]|uniref:Fucose permease n=1 Tax=Acidipila rosea TaxID=768535 RepID=A0A4R1L6K2_9BACT|nr:MFS transporter [Acidipila rosea]MBW4043500.1 MFS transporter [Acidobacteriota bacterium]TCK73802.1 fucose permease [Acidipila rosea]
MQITQEPISERVERGRQAILLLHFGFFLSGLATALPGALIPIFTRQWLLSDAYAGTLVAMQFLTSAMGAVLVAHRRVKTVRLGYLLAGAGFMLLSLDSRAMASAAFAAIGGGIGLAMTSTSLLISEVYPTRRGGALSLLNFSWGVGAMLAPALVRVLSVHGAIRSMFLTLAVLFALSLVLSMRLLHGMQGNASRRVQSASDTSLRAYFAMMLFLYVGIESSIGNWVTEFAERSSVGHHAWIAPYVASLFWGALLMGRALAPVVLRATSEFVLHVSASAAAVVAVVSLRLAGSYSGIAAAAIVAGFALAPVFPLGVSAVVSRSNGRSRLGWVFAFAGFGGAVFTWLEGQLSTSLHSLRSSFTLSAIGAMAMLLMTAVYPWVWRRPRK